MVVAAAVAATIRVVAVATCKVGAVADIIRAVETPRAGSLAMAVGTMRAVAARATTATTGAGEGASVPLERRL